MASLRDSLSVLEPLCLTAAPAAARDVASPDVLARVRALAGVHADVEAIWAWGLAPAALSLGALGLDGEPDWLSPPEALAALEELRAVGGFPADLVPVATDGAGNYLAVEGTTGRVVDWDHETRTSRPVAKGLAPLLAARVKRAQRAAKERAVAANARPAAPPSGLPKGLVKVASPDVTRLGSKGFGGGAEDAALSPDGRWLLVAFGGSAVLWDLEAHSEVEIPHRFRRAGYLAFDHAGRFLRDGGLDLVVCDAATGAMRARWAYSTSRPAGAVLEGGLVAVASNGEVHVWDVAALPGPSSLDARAPEAAPLCVLGAAELFRDGEVSLDVVGLGLVGDEVWIARRGLLGEDMIGAWSARTGACRALTSFRVREGSMAQCAAASPDGATLIVGCSGGEIVCFDGATLTRGEPVAAHAAGVASVAFAPSGAFFVTSGSDGLRLWESGSCRPLGFAKLPAKGAAVAVRAVTSAHVLTVSPLALFAFK